MATCSSLWRHVPGTLLSCLIRTIVIFNKFLTSIGNVQPNFCCHKAMQHLHHTPQFLLVVLFTQLAQCCCMGRQKSPYLFKTPEETSPVGRSLAVQEAYNKSYVVHRVLEPVTIKSRRKIFVYKRKKKSINNQTTQYNENDENTTVKDLQRRATFKRCVTKTLWFILSGFCRIDKK